VRKYLGLSLLVASATALPLVATSCRAPTAITLELTTDVPCSTFPASGAEILVGSAQPALEAPAAVATICRDKGDLGTLVLVPSGDRRARVVIETRLPLGGGACVEGKGCIVARRAISYAPSVPLRLPIRLRTSCANVACDSTSTCIDGACRSFEVALDRCTNGVCDEDAVGPGPADAGPAPDAGCSGAAVRCNGMCVDVSTDKAHCGGCGVDCTLGECTAGLCRLVPAANLTTNPSDTGCIAVEQLSGRVYWTSNRGGGGAVLTVPRAGGVPTASNPAQLLRTDGIAAGAGKVRVGGTLQTMPMPTSQIHEVTPGQPFALIRNRGTQAIPSVAIAAPFMCWMEDGSNPAVACEDLSGMLMPTATSIATGAATGGQVATSSTRWAAIVPPSAVIACGTPGMFGAMVGSMQATLAITAGAPSSPSSFYVAASTQVVSVDCGAGGPTFPELWAAPGAFAVAFDAATNRVHWLQRAGSNVQHVAHDLGGGFTMSAPVPLPVPTGGACLAVDTQALYFLSDGVPYKIAK
jgi:hypothetical protein